MVNINNLLLNKILKFYCGRAKIITSVQQPNFSTFSRVLIPLLKPDLVLVQSLETETMLASWGYRTEFLPNGVDSQKFMPVSSKLKQAFRQKYQVNTAKSVALHVGALRKWRNTDILSKVQQRGNNQIIVVASTTNPSEEAANQQLRQAGCLVWQAYLENIEEVYALSDCYIFPPTYKLGSIETPLSVMEAMSCNLPVISTRYGALPRLFTEGDGFYFVEADRDIIPLVKKIKANNREVRTREKVLAYTWENIAVRLEQLYREVLKK